MKTRHSIKKWIWQLGGRKKRKKQTDVFSLSIAEIARLRGGQGKEKKKTKHKKLTVKKKKNKN